MKLTIALTILIAAQLSVASAEDKTKLFEPYAPKPSGPTPEGWSIQILKGSSVESKSNLKNGREIKVNAPAYELVPQKGGKVLREPGFEAALANSQKMTIGALLTKYSETAGTLQSELEKTLGELEKGLQGAAEATPKDAATKEAQDNKATPKPSPTTKPEAEKKSGTGKPGPTAAPNKKP